MSHAVLKTPVFIYFYICVTFGVGIPSTVFFCSQNELFFYSVLGNAISPVEIEMVLSGVLFECYVQSHTGPIIKKLCY